MFKKDYKGLKITNENIVFQNWSDVKNKVLKNSRWNFVRIDFEDKLLIFENQRGIRARLVILDEVSSWELRKLNKMDCDKCALGCLKKKEHGIRKNTYSDLTDEVIAKIRKVKNWNLQFGRNMWGLTAPNQNIDIEKMKWLGFSFKFLSK